jgi:hypothetical protein
VPLLAQAPPRNQPPPAPGLTGETAVAATIASLDKTQMTVQALTQALRTLRANLNVAADTRAQVEKLAADASAAQLAGNLGAARRDLLHAVALQRGQGWDEKAETAHSHHGRRLIAALLCPADANLLGAVYRAEWTATADQDRGFRDAQQSAP